MKLIIVDILKLEYVAEETSGNWRTFNSSQLKNVTVTLAYP